MIRGRVPIGIDEHGAPIMKQIKAKNEYELMVRAGKMMIAAGVLDSMIPERTSAAEQSKSSPTFSELAERWYRIYKAENPNLRPATKSDYRRMLDYIIFPAIGNRRIDQITSVDLQEMLNRNSKIALSTQTKVIVTLRQVFEMAVQENYIVKNPAKTKLTKTGVEKKKGRAFNREEWLAVQNSLKDMSEADRVLSALILYEGLRRGEALGLTWDKIDFEKDCIHIVQQAAFNNGSNVATIQPPKTKSSVRDVPIVRPLKEILQSVVPEGKYVVGNEDEPYTKSMLTKALRRIKRATGIDDLHPHMFRYSHATMLHELGIDDKTIQHWEGHASQATTTNLYIKPSQTMTDKAQLALSEFACKLR